MAHLKNELWRKNTVVHYCRAEMFSLATGNGFLLPLKCLKFPFFIHHGTTPFLFVFLPLRTDEEFFVFRLLLTLLVLSLAKVVVLHVSRCMPVGRRSTPAYWCRLIFHDVDWIHCNFKCSTLSLIASSLNAVDWTTVARWEFIQPSQTDNGNEIDLGTSFSEIKWVCIIPYNFFTTKNVYLCEW